MGEFGACISGKIDIKTQLFYWPLQRLSRAHKNGMQRIHLLGPKPSKNKRRIHVQNNATKEIPETGNWEKEILQEIEPLGFQAPKIREKHEYYKDSEDEQDEIMPTNNVGWASKQRELSVEAIRAKGFNITEESLLPKTKKKKKKKKKLDPPGLKFKWSEFGNDEDSEDDEDDLRSKVQHALESYGGDEFRDVHENMLTNFKDTIANISGPSDRKKEIKLNRAIVEAITCAGVLNEVSSVMEAVYKGLRPSPLTPLNMATAIHRIAKNMERGFMSQSDRLAFARQRDMAVLVSCAMDALPSCSAQGISNIAWALSKIGGHLLYWSEMDRVAEVGVGKISEFNSQNLANIVGAFATMQHVSPRLFGELEGRACVVAGSFKPQELAQFLWAYASVYHPLDEFLDSLDTLLENSLDSLLEDTSPLSLEDNSALSSGSLSLAYTDSLEDNSPFGLQSQSLAYTDSHDSLHKDGPPLGYQSPAFNDSDVFGNGNVQDMLDSDSVEDEIGDNEQEDSGMGDLDDVLRVEAVDKMSYTQLANVAWSYAVLDEMDRPFFGLVWRRLSKFDLEEVSRQQREDVMFAWQVHQVNQCLKLEYSHLDLTLDKEFEERVFEVCKGKRFNEKVTSMFQKQVGRLLVSTGYKWEKEFSVDGYVLDAVISDKKVALEVDGPSHFARNTGDALGHTMLKRRYLTNAGWKMVSLAWRDWEELNGESEQIEFLRTILKDALEGDEVTQEEHTNEIDVPQT